MSWQTKLNFSSRKLLGNFFFFVLANTFLRQPTFLTQKNRNNFFTNKPDTIYDLTVLNKGNLRRMSGQLQVALYKLHYYWIINFDDTIQNIQGNGRRFVDWLA